MGKDSERGEFQPRDNHPMLIVGRPEIQKGAFPDPTDLTKREYHHSSANGTFTPLSSMKTRVRRAATVIGAPRQAHIFANNPSSRLSVQRISGQFFP